MKLLLTGPSGSGKTTISNILKRAFPADQKVIQIDGDDLRRTLNSDLSFSDKSIMENMRRVGELSDWLIETGQADHVIATVIAPIEVGRLMLKKRYGFKVIFIDRPECYDLDLKGLYKSGKQREYEPVECHDLVIDNSIKNGSTPAWCANQISLRFRI